MKKLTARQIEVLETLVAAGGTREKFGWKVNQGTLNSLGTSHGCGLVRSAGECGGPIEPTVTITDAGRAALDAARK